MTDFKKGARVVTHDVMDPSDPEFIPQFQGIRSELLDPRKNGQEGVIFEEFLNTIRDWPNWVRKEDLMAVVYDSGADGRAVGMGPLVVHRMCELNLIPDER